MNNFVFKIFGAPNTFDLYQGNESEIGYFQNFDNGGKEKARLTVHRMASGKVSYSYLRYNFLSSGGRTNSWFGMSILFDNEYCRDAEQIFDLFDVVYKDVILKNGILITELENNPTAQAKYLVKTFSEAEGEVRKVESNIIDNLRKHFADDILPIDRSFLESNSTIKLNNQMDSSKFVNALRKYSWVHISPEYSKNETPVPNPEFLKSLDDIISEVQKQIPIISLNALNRISIEDDTNKYLSKTKDSLNKIYAWLENEYKPQKGKRSDMHLQKQPELKHSHDELLGIQKQLNDLLKAVGLRKDELIRTPVVIEPQPLPVIKKSFWQEHKLKVIGLAACLIAIFTLIIIFFPDDKPTVASTSRGPKSDLIFEEGKDEKLLADGNKALQENKFDDAILKFTQAGKTVMADNAKSKAIQYWNTKALEADTSEESIDFLNKTKIYGNNPTKDIADYQKKIDKQIANAGSSTNKKNKVEKKIQEKAQDVTRPMSQTTSTYTNVTIQISEKKQTYSVGDQFTVIAKSGTENCVGGEWRFENGLNAVKYSNPTQVTVLSVPIGGKAALRYYINNAQIEGIEIKISQ